LTTGRIGQLAAASVAGDSSNSIHRDWDARNHRLQRHALIAPVRGSWPSSVPRWWDTQKLEERVAALEALLNGETAKARPESSQ